MGNVDYFISQLEDAGALKKNPPGKIDQKTLVKVSNLSVGLVLAAKAVGTFSDSDIVRWIRKGARITPPATEQLLKYNELAYYLINQVEEADVNKWKDVLSNTRYICPSGENKDKWCKVFGDKAPAGLCNKIDCDLKIKVESEIDLSDKLIKKETKEGCVPKEEIKMEKSEEVKLKQVEKNKEENEDDTSNKESEDRINDESNRSSLGEGDDQLDFLFNEDEELDYEYDTVNGHENDDIKQSENHEDEELDYEYDAANGLESEELNDNDMKESENNENEVENPKEIDQEENQKNKEICSDIEAAG